MNGAGETTWESRSKTPGILRTLGLEISRYKILEAQHLRVAVG